LPLLRKLSGRVDLAHRSYPATLGRELPQNDERADYLRAILEERADGTLVATPLQQQDSSMMANLARANCLVIREPHALAAATGSPCIILKLGL
jgi:molybdopterin molybdotransferase